MRLIDADALLKIYRGWLPQLESPEDKGDRTGVETCIAVLEDAPTIDAVPVVRCEDCKHFRCNLENDTYCDCVGGLTDPEENDFCSYGERRSDD